MLSWMVSSLPRSAPDEPRSYRLEQVLGLFSVVAIVVGQVIGSGIFFKPQQVAVATEGFVGLILALWVVCGLVNLCGALALAELSAMFPQAGGTYVFLRETYGRPWSFLWAWAEFWVIRSGAIAALAVYMAVALDGIAVDLDYPLLAGHQKQVAIGAIVALGAINILGTRWGGGLLNVATVIKAAFVAFLALLPLIAIRSEPFDLGTLWPTSIDQGARRGHRHRDRCNHVGLRRLGQCDGRGRGSAQRTAQRPASAGDRRAAFDRALYGREPRVPSHAIVS